MSALKRKAGTQSGPDAKKPKQAQGNIMSFFGPPKVTPAAANSGASASAAGPGPAGFKFDKAKWVASLTDEQRDLLKLEIDTLHESWLALLKDEVVTKEFLELKRFLDREHNAGKKVFPPKEDVYSWFVLTLSPYPNYPSVAYITITGPATPPSIQSRW
jgi:uracil-DNA glycosylase